MKNKAYVIGISGGSGSGKSTLSNIFTEKLDNAYYICVDKHYKKELPTMISPMDSKEYPDWNHPNTVNVGNLLKEIEEELYSHDYIVIDGAFLFCLEEVLPLLDYKIYVDATIEMRLFRRIKRNVIEKQQTIEFIGSYYLNCARFREKEFSNPSKYLADIVIDNENGFKGEDLKAIEIIKTYKKMSLHN
ncbi:MAG: AAA family ATPase [Clostridia bacterium]